MAEQEQVPCMIYLITPAKIDDLDAFAGDLDAALADEMVACVQLRLKGADDDQIIAAAEKLMPVCHKYEVAFLINDRADIAAEVDADGVHLGQGDGDIASARSLLGAGKDIGVTCHDSMHLAYEAGEAGANYVAFGAFFNSVTKATDFQADPELLTAWDTATELPSVAIGGINATNARSLADAGAHFVAVCSAVWDHADGPAAGVKAIYDALSA